MKLITAALVLASSCAPVMDEQSMQNAILSVEFIAVSPPTPQCHASTIVEVEGELLVAWFGGTHEGADDVGIWLSRKSGAGWSLPMRVADGAGEDGQVYPSWNPVLHQSRSGPLMLFYKAGPNPRAWWGMLTTSSDRGQTWSAPVRLPLNIIGPVKNKPLEFEDGEILCPSSTEHDGWQVWLERTRDLGVTWERSGPFNDPAEIEAIQPSILRKGMDTLLAVGRTRQDRMFVMQSADRGLHWSKMKLLDFWCANSGIDGITLKDGRMLVVYNHSQNSPADWSVGREMLNIAVSRDGVEWKRAAVLEREADQEFSYPAVIQTRDGMVHVTYTWKRQRIRHVVLDPQSLQETAFTGWDWE
ncbi:MAG: exo-alpha-sialidase [Bacteroidetes bacterium]|nr:exo-alpha-sialidase [Bacteroidota bacterium]